MQYCLKTSKAVTARLSQQGCHSKAVNIAGTAVWLAAIDAVYPGSGGLDATEIANINFPDQSHSEPAALLSQQSLIEACKGNIWRTPAQHGCSVNKLCPKP